MKVQNIFLLAVFVAISIIALIFYIQFSNLKKDLIESENKVLVLTQNEEAYKNQLQMQADSIQNYALMVKNLQTKTNKLENQYIILESKYRILLDSISVVNDSAVANINDDTLKIDFGGIKGKYTYEGSAFYSFINKSAWHNMMIKSEGIDIYNKIYIDESNKLLKSLIYADGNLITNAITDIDSLIYLKLFGVNNNQIDIGFWDRLKLYTDFYGKTNISNYKEIKEYNLNLDFGIKYQFDDFEPYLSKSIVNQELKFGLRYNQSIRQIITKIF